MNHFTDHPGGRRTTHYDYDTLISRPAVPKIHALFGKIYPKKHDFSRYSCSSLRLALNAKPLVPVAKQGGRQGHSFVVSFKQGTAGAGGSGHGSEIAVKSLYCGKAF
jgi:hypothetical protein